MTRALTYPAIAAFAAGVEGDIAGHSLRRDFITSAAKKKVAIENIKRVTGQRSSAIVLDYVGGRDTYLERIVWVCLMAWLVS